ncbi:dTDP-4-dehydrorhamnose 3,5-epimerase family protein [Leptospira vanthielii]|uniref:dTDP-4-dehydrorhamnose 3,5-epimerase n=1 Tax=Leptospira vanthielii TaxID=293085 RepID=A0ABY2NSQ1_9LEPT|nr:dTDP-4-dehydrorhamnose 3,5-epimerase family protein [Leptospira vanthielii]TGM60663.1 dTDP-4-keto-6-deoxy-D-glucose epimerase [Leptospira vanthielii]
MNQETFIIHKTPISELYWIKRSVIGDHRGSLSRLFCGEELARVGFDLAVAQVNITKTQKKGTIRGLHFQFPPYAEHKLIYCLKGEVFDIALDLRQDSPTFLNYHSIILSEKENNAYSIPRGFAHGFQSLTDDVEMLYFHSQPYMKDFESGINPFDPKINVNWPLAVSEISERDKSFFLLDNTFKGVNVK